MYNVYSMKQPHIHTQLFSFSKKLKSVRLLNLDYNSRYANLSTLAVCIAVHLLRATNFLSLTLSSPHSILTWRTNVKSSCIRSHFILRFIFDTGDVLQHLVHLTQLHINFSLPCYSLYRVMYSMCTLVHIQYRIAAGDFYSSSDVEV